MPSTMTASSIKMLTTSPMMTELSVFFPFEPSSTTVWLYLHSSAIGDSATRGGFTTRDGTMARPATSGSLMVSSSSAPVEFISLRRS